jgi:hypothetical protein
MRIAVMLFVLFLGACESGPPTRGVPVAFNAVCNKDNQGKRVMVEGYVNFPDSFKENEVSIMLRMRPGLGLEEAPLGVSAKLGNEVNSIELPPSRFNNTDLKLHLADGKVAGYADKLKVSGTMYYPSSIAHVEFKCGLSNTLYEPAQ